MAETGRVPAAWYPDPTARHEHRFWDGTTWTIHVADAGVPSIDPRVQAPPFVEQACSISANPEAVPAGGAGLAAWEAAWESQRSEGVTQPSAPRVEPSLPQLGQRRRKVWLIAVAFVAVCAAGLGIAKFARGSDDESVQRYPAAIESNFLHGCTANGGEMDMCHCSLTSIERQYDLASFMTAEQSYRSTGVMPTKMMLAAADCQAALNKQFNDAGEKLKKSGD